MTESEEKRLWSAIDGMVKKLDSMDTKLSEMVRLEERVRQHGGILSRFGKLHDDKEQRLREVELAVKEKDYQLLQLDHKIEKLPEGNCDDCPIEPRIIVLETSKARGAGRMEVVREAFKWVAGLAAVVIAYRLTNGDTP